MTTLAIQNEASGTCDVSAKCKQYSLIHSSWKIPKADYCVEVHNEKKCIQATNITRAWRTCQERRRQ